MKRSKSSEDQEGVTKEDLKKMADRYKQRGLLTFSLIMLTRQITSSIKTGLAALKRYRDTIENEMDQKMIDVLINEGTLIDADKKIDTLLQIAKKEKEHKIIIFTSFIQTQKTIELELQLAGFSTVLFNGKMNPQEKEDAIEQFRGEKQVLICTDAGSEGRNLQFAHILINFDLPWNPMVIEQRIGRVHRIGQTRDVKIINLAVSNTIEAYILNRLYEKINLFHAAIGEMDLILTQLGSKKGVEIDIFEAFMNDEDVEQIGTDLERAVKKVDYIKALDAEVFDKGGKNGS